MFNINIQNHNSASNIVCFQYNSSLGISWSKAKLNKIQVLQKKILLISVNAPWFVRNKHLHDELGISTINDFIKSGVLKFLNNLNFVPGAMTYNIGQPRLNRRLSARLPQDILPQDIIDE
jgi:hypothetical protein